MQSKDMQAKQFKQTEPQKGDYRWDYIQEQIKQHFQGKKASTLVTMHHGICLGIYENGEFVMPASLPLQPEHLRSVRVFDRDSECYVWKSSMDSEDIFRLRIRQDEEDHNGEQEAIEASQLLWGTRLEECPEDSNWKILKEERGIELRVHKSLIPASFTVNKSNRLWLITRNYIDYTPVGQAGYVDCRFVSIVGEEE